MASNNRKAPQRCPPKNNDDRNRHPASRVQQTGGSLHAKRRVDNKKVQETLDDMFVNVFDSEIIRSVAHSCGWNLNKSIEALIMLAEGGEFPSSKSTESLGNTVSSHSPISSCSSREKVPSMSKSKCGKESNNKPGTSGCYKSNTPSKCKPNDICKTKSVMMNSSQGTLKVTYKGRDDPDLSDDDADIVIEEENECDISELDIGFTDVPNQSVCQFLAPSVSHDQPLLKRYTESLTTSPRENIPLSTSSKVTSKNLNLLAHKSGSTFSSQGTSQVKKTKHWPKFERIKKEINEGIKVMILMRGCPGSGKTSLARHIVKVTYGEDEQNYIFSTDHYFVFYGNGKYLFDPRLLPTAHEWNQKRVKENASKGINPIIIDNTNLEVWEMEPYAKIAVKFGYNLELLEPRTSWRNNSYELERKNTHNVPRRKIEDMLVRFERDLTSAKLLSLLNLKYSPYNTPPQQTCQPRPSLCKNDASLSGAKKKSTTKKREENIDKNSHSESVNSVRNVKPIQLSVELGCDIADREIKESVDLLLSEWNRSVNSQLSGKGNTDMNKPGHYSPKKTEMFTEFRKESCEQKVFGVLNTEVTSRGGEEMDCKNCSTENSEEELDITGISDEWEDESEDEDTICSNTSFLDITREIIGPVTSDQKEETHCMEYALVLKDGTLLPQRSYYKENSCSDDLKENERKWEYLLMADDSKLLFNHPKENSSNGNSEVKDDTEAMHDGVMNEASKEETLTTTTKKTAEYIFMKNWEEEKSQLESFLFPDIEDESIIHSKFINNTLKDTEKKENSVAYDKTNQSLDKLIVESAASLNIAFAGIDDSTSSEGSQPTLLLPCPSNDNIKSGHPLDNLTSLVELSEDSATEVCVPTGETSSDSGVQIKDQAIDEFTCNSIYCSVDGKADSIESESVLNKDHSETFLNSDKPKDDYNSSNQTLVENDNTTAADNELGMMRGRDIFPRNVCSEQNTTSVSNTSILNTNKSNMSEQDVMAKWAEGKSWDDQESVDIEKIIESSAPKPARNYKRPFNTEVSPKKAGNENLGMLREVAVDESWCALDEPVSSWKEETENDDKDVKKTEEKIVPQPQRQVFATSLKEISNDKEKHITIEEIKDISDSGERMKDHKIGDIALTESANIVEDLIQLAVSEESKNVEDRTSLLSTLQLQKQTVTLPQDIFSVNDLATAVSNHSVSEETDIRTVAHSSTNTHHSDFITLSNVNIGSDVEDLGVKVLPTIGRNIIDFEITANNHCRKVGKVLMLDKSSMTYDIISSIPETENMTEQLQELVNMFPHCSIEDLQEIFEKCNKDINWTVDLLLESASQGIEISTLNNTYRSEPKTDILVNINSSESKNETQNHSDGSKTDSSNNDDNASAVDSLQPVPSNSLLLTPASHDTSTKSPSQNKRNGKKDRTSISEMSLLLKKQLEENIVINDEHYSEHVSRIRKLRHGEVTDGTEAGGTQTVGECFSEYSQQGILLDTSAQEISHLHTSLEPNYILRPDAPEWELSDVDFKALNEEEEETVPVRMDVEFAEQLHCLFGTASLPFKQDLKPMLNLPMSLARQLHYYMMEAEQNTYDLMMQEDEELARKLQGQEDNVNAETFVPTPNQVPDLSEIMDMEMALALYKADQKQSTTENKEDLATKLTKNLLCEWFPSLPRDVLINVFEAHNNSFEHTLEVLLASTGEDTSVRIVMTPEARAAHEQALLVKASQEGEKSKESLQDSPVVGEIVTQDQALQDADFFRSEASRHYSLRNECQQKAQRSYQRGLTAAAAYYSQMASLHKRRIEESNAKAASSLLLAHSLGNLSSTLDLHFLYVVEALQVLDMFLDHHIHQLMESNHRSVQVFVITGRGARSTGGRSRIKPAVVQRLEQRDLRHEEVNPGLLKVIITRTATSSTRITS